MRPLPKRAKGDSVVSLINIVFLILIFFMIAGTLSRPMLGDIRFVETSGLECCVDQDGLVISKRGELTANGQSVASIHDYLFQMDGPKVVHIIPDRDLPAQELLLLVSSLKEAGVEQIVVLTEDQG